MIDIKEIEQAIEEKRTELSRRTGNWDEQSQAEGAAELAELIKRRGSIITELNEEKNRELVKQAKANDPSGYAAAEKEICKIDRMGYPEVINVFNDLFSISERVKELKNLYFRRQTLTSKYPGFIVVSDFCGAMGLLIQLEQIIHQLETNMRVVSSQLPDGIVSKIYKGVKRAK